MIPVSKRNQNIGMIYFRIIKKVFDKQKFVESWRADTERVEKSHKKAQEIKWRSQKLLLQKRLRAVISFKKNRTKMIPFFAFFKLKIYISQLLENSSSLNKEAKPVICFRRNNSSADMPMLRQIQESLLPISKSSATMLLIRSTLWLPRARL